MKLKTPNFQRKDQSNAQNGAPMPLSAAPPSRPGTPPSPPGTPVSPAPPSPIAPLRKAAPVQSSPARQKNAAAMIAGLAFILIAAAMAASVANSFDDTLEVLVADAPIIEGQRVQASDFRSVQIAAAEGDIQAMAPSSMDDLIGRVAAGPIGEGSMIHRDQFAVAESEELVVIGVALGPDQFPVRGAQPGDQVRLIEVAGQFDTGEVSVSGSELGVGEVTAVANLNGQEMHFSVRVSESIANIVAQRVAQDRLTIALLDRSDTLEVVTPFTPAELGDPLELDFELPGASSGEGVDG